MRTLSIRQKKQLDLLIEAYHKETGRFPFSTEDFDYQKILRIDNLDPHENFDSQADRYIADRYYAEERKKSW